MRQEEEVCSTSSRNLGRRDLGTNQGRFQEFVRINCNKELTPVGKVILQTENRTGDLPTKKQHLLIPHIRSSVKRVAFPGSKTFRCCC